MLTQAGKIDTAYRLLHAGHVPILAFLREAWRDDIWERWDGWTPEKGFQDPGMNSFNHYALAPAANGCSKRWRASGSIPINRLQAHHRSSARRRRPDLGAGEPAASVHGPIESSWKLKDGALSLDVTVPTNTTATVS